MMFMLTLRHLSTALVSLLITGSMATSSASAPAQLPCAVWSSSQSSVCMRLENQNHFASAFQTSSANLAIDQAMGSLKDDIQIVQHAQIDTPTMQVSVRNSAPKITTAVKNTSNKAKTNQVAAAAIKPKLTRSEIVRQELQREKAALRAAENQLNQAKKSGKNVNKWERQVADRRASISAMQSELSRL